MRKVFALLLSVVPFALGCGARSGTDRPGVGQPLEGGTISVCLGDLDCPSSDACAPIHCVAGACVAAPKVVCDDGDPCTEDGCVPATGKCEFKRLNRDEDGDGHFGPIPGFSPGAPGACGDDCDDSSPLAHPGGTEACDGVDNDCNGVVDDGANYVPSSAAPVLLSTNARQAGLGGIRFGSSAFGVTFAEQNDSWANTFAAVDQNGNVVVPAVAITHENTDAFTGPIAWTGSVFGVAWEDRRDQDFEIYFNRIDGKGQKLSRDLRVTNAPEFSLRPDVVWTGTEFVVVWTDRRQGDDRAIVFGQRIDADGRLVGGNVPITPPAEDGDAPHVARGETGLGVVYNAVSGIGVRQLVFRTVSPDLNRIGGAVVLGGRDAASSAITWSQDRYVVVWDTSSRAWGPTIRGAAVAGDGSVLVPERDVTAPAAFARSEALLPLGDRLLVVWAEYGGAAYGLYSKLLTPALNELTPKQKLSTGAADALNPGIAFGPEGTVAVAFEDRQSGSFQVYTTHLSCSGGR